MSFFFSKTESRQIKQVLSRAGTHRRGKDIKKRHRKVNMVEILHMSMYVNGK
jgi:hypothetical protein